MSRVEEAARQTLEYVPGMLVGLAVLCLLYFAYFYGQTGADDDNAAQPAPASSHGHSGQLHVVVPDDDDADGDDSDDADGAESEADE